MNVIERKLLSIKKKEEKTVHDVLNAPVPKHINVRNVEKEMLKDNSLEEVKINLNEYQQSLPEDSAEFYKNSQEEFEEEFVNDTASVGELIAPSIEDKEESMDRIQDQERFKGQEDTSGKTESFIVSFLENYANGNDLIQTLRQDLMRILSDIQWIKESNNQNEQWALDFADALNEASTSI